MANRLISTFLLGALAIGAKAQRQNVRMIFEQNTFDTARAVDNRGITLPVYEFKSMLRNEQGQYVKTYQARRNRNVNIALIGSDINGNGRIEDFEIHKKMLISRNDAGMYSIIAVSKDGKGYTMEYAQHDAGAKGKGPSYTEKSGSDFAWYYMAEDAIAHPVTTEIVVSEKLQPGYK